MNGFPEYDAYDGLGLADLVRQGAVQPAELVEEAIARIERVNPQLNAVIHRFYDRARGAAAGNLPDGPFRGVPFLLKDLLAAYRDAPFCSGSRFFKDHVADEDSPMIRRFEAAGLIIIGKTNAPELGLTPVTEPELFGPTLNPWDPTLTAGGSSGGAAAAVAAGIVPLAHGGDGGGSIRIPASCCGLFGFKPTRRRTPGSFNFEPWQGAVCEHVLTRSVRDSAAMLDVLAGPTPGAPYYPPPPVRTFLSEVGAAPGRLRIAFTDQPFLGHHVADDCRQALAAAVALCRELGHELVAAAPAIDGPAFARAFLTMLCGEVRADILEAELRLGRKASSADFERDTWALGLLGGALSAADFTVATRTIQRISTTLGQFFSQYDVLLTPTLATPPVPTGTLRLAGFEGLALDVMGRLHAGGLLKALHMIDTAATTVYQFVPYTPLFNASGQPAMSVPLHWNPDGVPIGVHFVGRYADEATLFRLAGQLEQAQPWAQRRPPIHAARLVAPTDSPAPVRTDLMAS